MNPLERNNVRDGGGDAPAMIFIHGFGCDQTMWNAVAPAFEDTHRVITYDLTGMGQSDLEAYDFDRHGSLAAHAQDLLEICDALGVRDAILVGHSVGAQIAALAAKARPDRVAQLIMVSPSPSFTNDPATGYQGGFDRSELEGLVSLLKENHLGWSTQMAPTIAGEPAGAPSADALTKSFCRTDPEIAQHFGEATFFADERETMRSLTHPSLILHCDEDALAPMSVADWMRANVPNATLTVLHSKGHCPHMTSPNAVITSMQDYLARH
jgi:sigma-B regulation protein RsbQ